MRNKFILLALVWLILSHTILSGYQEPSQNFSTGATIVVLESGIKKHSLKAWNRLINDSAIYFFDVEKKIYNDALKNSDPLFKLYSNDYKSKSWLLTTDNKLMASGDNLPSVEDLKSLLTSNNVKNKLTDLEKCQRSKTTPISVSLQLAEMHLKRAMAVLKYVSANPDGKLSEADDLFVWGDFSKQLDNLMQFDRKVILIDSIIKMMPKGHIESTSAIIKTKYGLILPEYIDLMKLKPIDGLFYIASRMDAVLGQSNVPELLASMDFNPILYNPVNHFFMSGNFGKLIWEWAKNNWNIKDNNVKNKLLDLLQKLWMADLNQMMSAKARLYGVSPQDEVSPGYTYDQYSKNLAQSLHRDLLQNWDGYLAPYMELLLSDKTNDTELLVAISLLDERWKTNMGERIKRLIISSKREDILDRVLSEFDRASLRPYYRERTIFHEMACYVRSNDPGNESMEIAMRKFKPLVNALKHYGYFIDNPVKLPPWFYNDSKLSHNSNNFCILVDTQNRVFIFDENITIDKLITELKMAAFDRPLDYINKVFSKSPDDVSIKLTRMGILGRMIYIRQAFLSMSKIPESVVYESFEELLTDYIKSAKFFLDKKEIWFLFEAYLAYALPRYFSYEELPVHLAYQLDQFLTDLESEISLQPDGDLYFLWSRFASFTERPLHKLLSKMNSCNTATDDIIKIDFIYNHFTILDAGYFTKVPMYSDTKQLMKIIAPEIENILNIGTRTEQTAGKCEAIWKRLIEIYFDKQDFDTASYLLNKYGNIPFVSETIPYFLDKAHTYHVEDKFALSHRR